MEDKEYKCPLLNRLIDEGYCEEVNLVIKKILKAEALEDVIDREHAKVICSNCEYGTV
jgi:hypothetical protein